MDLEVVLVPNGEWKKFEDFLKSLNVKYRIREEKLQIRPALILRKNKCEIVYHAIPAGNELEPFLKTLEILSESKCKEINGEIMIFITPTCPICANVVEIGQVGVIKTIISPFTASHLTLDKIFRVLKMVRVQFQLVEHGTLFRNYSF